MKRGIWLGLWMVLFLSACQKNDDPAPGERPDERLNKVLSDYKTMLVGAEHGWKATLLPEGGAGYSFHLRFTANDRVTMRSDINPTTAAEPFESSYRLKATQRPSLLFDTYSYLHLLSDPDAAKSGGDYGQGKYSDFEFSFDSATADQINLTGNLKGSKLVLQRATADEAASFVQRVAATARAFENINVFTTYFKRLVLGANNVDVAVDTNLRTITFSYFEGTVLRTFSTSYRYTQTGIELLAPLELPGGTSVSSFSNIQYTAANRRLNLTVNNVAATIQEATRPIITDQGAAQRFFNLPAEDYLASGTGFTVNGVADAYKVLSIPNYFFTIYWPKYTVSNGSRIDMTGFVLLNSATNQAEIAPMPAALSPRVTNDGRIVFTLLGTFGTDPPPFQETMNAVYQQWTEPQGYYVVPIGSGSFDLVSARDAKAWIRLE